MSRVVEVGETPSIADVRSRSLPRGRSSAAAEGAEHDLRRIRKNGALRPALEEAGGAYPRNIGLRGKIAGEYAIGREVAIVVAVVVEPAAGPAVAYDAML